MKAKIADYILILCDAAARTHQAEDRPIYQRYLADAAIILALVESGAPASALREAIENHERLWGHTWLRDDAYKAPSSAWQEVKRCMELEHL